jgi:glucose-1-phosphate adenylyltransferase
MPHTDVLALILGGGAGSRLYPLTKLRAKPAVPIAGNYRLVDIPISNCLNSGIDRIFVLTQFNSVSLHRHITQTYKFDIFSRGWVQILAAEQTPTSTDWYQGTADAIRKQRTELEAVAPREVVILAGDHLYRMDYAAFVRAHRDAQADVTVAVLPVSRADASRFGIVQTNAQGQIVAFHEKPTDPALLDRLAVHPDPARPYLGSMGVYVFRTRALYDLLDSEPGSDFGKHILPASLGRRTVQAFPFDGYWEDIGTIRSFYEANLALLEPDARFSFYDPVHPIYTHPRFLPPSQIDEGCTLEAVLVSGGTRIVRSAIDHAIVGVRAQIGPDVHLSRTIVMGADYFETDGDRAANAAQGLPNIGVGAGSRIAGAIIDKNARIGRQVVIRGLTGRPDLDSQHYAIRDGIVIVTKDAVVPDGTTI